MSKSAFAELLTEARDVLRARQRRAVALHFDWDGTDGPESWRAWHDPAPGEKLVTYSGMAGEQALRMLVEALRASTT